MDDIKNIRVSEKSNSVLEDLSKTQGLFKDAIDAARFSFSYALNNNLDTDFALNNYSTGQASFNKWDIGAFDTDGAIRLLILKRHPESECPYRIMQTIVNLGLESISNKIPNSGLVKISNFM